LTVVALARVSLPSLQSAERDMHELDAAVFGVSEEHGASALGAKTVKVRGGGVVDAVCLPHDTCVFVCCLCDWVVGTLLLPPPWETLVCVSGLSVPWLFLRLPTRVVVCLCACHVMIPVRVACGAWLVCSVPSPARRECGWRRRRSDLQVLRVLVVL
jgi:hypothetical protein